MTGFEALEFIHSISRFGSKPGLRRIKKLLEYMGNPQDKLQFIHVAGTNGKGSTCSMLSHILTDAGYKTGLYISPFVIDFCERIQVNGNMIPMDELAICTEHVKKYWDILDAQGDTPSEFEVVVAVAIEYFTRQECDIVVLEVGMGGRFDATNIIKTPLCSIITSISLDHQDYLGSTVDKIALEKCGIIKPDGITITYPLQNIEALVVIMSRCAEENNVLITPNALSVSIVSQDIYGSRFNYDNMEIYVPLGGDHQIYNTLMVLECIKALNGYNISSENIIRGISQTTFPSRLEVLKQSPLIILDGAHNCSGATALGNALKMLNGRNIHAVIGVLADKDIKGVLGEILPYCKSLTATTPDNARAISASKLAKIAEEFCENIYIQENSTIAVQQAFKLCGEKDVLLICGSLYLAAAVRSIALEL